MNNLMVANYLCKTKQYLIELAEREGFEPSIPLRVCRISSAVLSTTQPPLRTIIYEDFSGFC
jgi:hypothetical protein